MEQRDRPELEIEITPEMLTAGSEEVCRLNADLYELTSERKLDALLRAIYLAMRGAQSSDD